MKLYLTVAFLISIVWALGILGSGVYLLLYYASDWNPAFLPYLIGSVAAWFGGCALSKWMLRNHSTVNGRAV